jgi:hypothetical protein
MRADQIVGAVVVRARAKQVRKRLPWCMIRVRAPWVSLLRLDSLARLP